jgi:glycosyltransferase involved in cell wall biosynthesis
MRAFWTRVVARSLELAGFDSIVPWAIAAWAKVDRDARYHCVLVSAGPFSTLFAGLAAARSMGIPLILDYRDVWNDTPHTSLRCSTRWLERMVLRRAALVVSISPSCLESIVGRVAVPRIVVTNGISEDVIQLAANLPPPEGRGLVYAGAFYPPKRSFEPIAAALATLRRQNNDTRHQVACCYLGPSAAYVKEVAERHGVSDAVQTTGAVSRRESLMAQAGSLCTVVVTSIEKTCCLADRGIVTGKLFEAIALAPWVLVISPIDSDVRALTAQMPHVRHFHGGEVQAIADWLAEIAAAPPRRPPSACWQSFTWPLLGQRFATAVEAAVAQSPQLRAGVPV